ncbi:MAG: methyltransferase family protein, partial [Rickettsiales bacterium]
CLAIYVSSTISLGVRFSNLTYRGLVTNGCYRFSKHPGYVGKNLSWWLISIPFISNEGVGTAIAHSAALIGINVIYFIRARTEERHLSNYPEYVEYALVMNERSIFAPLAKRVPFLIYKKPENPPAI